MMTVKQLVEKLQNVDQDRDIYLDDGFSVNLIEAETVVEDNSNQIIVISPREAEQDDLLDNMKLL
ncbi:hypothetical protein ACTS9D_00735 [Empedobacter brevis]